MSNYDIAYALVRDFKANDLDAVLKALDEAEAKGRKDNKMIRFTTIWRGKPVSECTREELLEMISKSDEEYSIYRDWVDNAEIKKLNEKIKTLMEVIEKLK